MSDADFIRLVYIFVLCTTIFPNSYYIVKPKHLSIVKDLDTFEGYVRGIDVPDNLLLEHKCARNNWV